MPYLISGTSVGTKTRLGKVTISKLVSGNESKVDQGPNISELTAIRKQLH